jgi:hypothetical protein
MRTPGCLAAAVLLSLGIFAATTAVAQDSNYWSTGYGTRAQLLGGVVIGSPGDISSVYYNPGALALAPNTEFLLAGNAFQYMRVSVANGSGPRRDLVSSTVTTVPSLLAGELPVLKHDRLAYSYLTRQQVDLDMEQRLTTVSVPILPNATFAAFDLQYHQSVSESWYGLTWAHQLSPTLGIGVTPALALRSQRTIASLFAMAENAGGQQAVLQQTRDFDFLHWRLLARLGLSGVRDSLTYGVTFTTPGLGLFGGGAYRQSVNLTDQSGTVGNVIGASYQDGLKADYRSPSGAGAGASFGWGSMRIHAAAEWWGKVDLYNVLEGEPFVIKTPIGDSTVTTTVAEDLKSVFNWGIGLEQRFTPSVSGYASYHTDHSGRAPDSPPNLSVTAWDLNHVSAGITFDAWRSNFAIGGSAAFGSRPIKSFGPRIDRIPSAELESSALILTGTLGWKIAF